MRYIDFKKLLFSRMPMLMHLPFEIQEKIITNFILEMGLDPGLGIELLNEIKVNHAVNIAADSSMPIIAVTSVGDIVPHIDIATDSIADVFVNAGFMCEDNVLLTECKTLPLIAEYDIKFNDICEFECKSRNMIDIVKSFRIKGSSVGADIHPSHIVEMDLRYNPEIRLNSAKVPVVSSKPESMSLSGTLSKIEHNANVHISTIMTYGIKEYVKENFGLDVQVSFSRPSVVAIKDKTKPNVIVELGLLKLNIWFNIQDYLWSDLNDSTWLNIKHI